MNWFRIIVAVIIYLTPNLASANILGSKPPKDLLNKELRYVTHYGIEGSSTTVGMFVEHVRTVGIEGKLEWEKVSDKTWIARIKKRDPMTNTNSEIAFQINDGVVDRIAAVHANQRSTHNTGSEIVMIMPGLLSEAPTDKNLAAQATRRAEANLKKQEEYNTRIESLSKPAAVNTEHLVYMIIKSDKKSYYTMKLGDFESFYKADNRPTRWEDKRDQKMIVFHTALHGGEALEFHFKRKGSSVLLEEVRVLGKAAELGVGFKAIDMAEEDFKDKKSKVSH
jgi:hypothetical protein